MFDLPTVPELGLESVAELSQEQLRQQILILARQPGVFGTKDPLPEKIVRVKGW